MNLRFTVPERRRIFCEGLKRNGYEIVEGLTNNPEKGDILVSWNRIHAGEAAARAFTQKGLPVIIAENASWGNEFAGRNWYTLALTYHNVADKFPVGDKSRWDRIGVELHNWRNPDQYRETVILPSRGIGASDFRMPQDWLRRVESHGRIRAHPGQGACIPLADDLSKSWRVLTWGSGAAVKALMWGIKVFSYQPGWIAAQDNTDHGRLEMFRRLAWAQYELHEIESGYAFDRLLAARG